MFENQQWRSYEKFTRQAKRLVTDCGPAEINTVCTHPRVHNGNDIQYTVRRLADRLGNCVSCTQRNAATTPVLPYLPQVQCVPRWMRPPMSRHEFASQIAKRGKCRGDARGRKRGCVHNMAQGSPCKHV